MARVPSDDEVRAAADEFANALQAASDAVYRSEVGLLDDLQSLFQAPDVEAARPALLEACERALVFRPEVFLRLAQDLQHAAGVIDEEHPDSSDFYDGFGLVPTQLAGWRGHTKEAFLLHINRMQKFAREQSSAMSKVGGLMASAYGVSAGVRADLVAIFREGISACQALVADEEAQDRRASTYLYVGLVTGVMAAVTPGVTALATVVAELSIALNSYASFVVVDISGGTPQELFESVQLAQRGVLERMDAGVEEVIRQSDQIGPSPVVDSLFLTQPLPPASDVADPSFRYDGFASPSRPPESGFGDAVEQTAAPTQTPPAERVGNIRRALG